MLNRYIVIYTRDRRNSGWHGDRRSPSSRDAGGPHGAYALQRRRSYPRLSEPPI